MRRILSIQHSAYMQCRMCSCAPYQNQQRKAENDSIMPISAYAWNSSRQSTRWDESRTTGFRFMMSLSGASFTSANDGLRSVNIQMIIIKNAESGSGRPRKKLANIGNSSDQLPAGSRYSVTFLRLSDTSRPVSMAVTTDTKLLSSSIMSLASCATSAPASIATPTSARFSAG